MAKRKITYDANGIPNRVLTGIGDQTITFPTSYFYGHPDSFQFSSSVMEKHWLAVKALCERQGLTHIVIGAALRDGYMSSAGSFVVVAGDDTGTKLVWHRYLPNNPEGAMNRIFLGGKEYKMTAFKDASLDAQDRMFEPVEMRHIMRRLAAGKMPYESQTE
jgi:hypothetical protein